MVAVAAAVAAVAAATVAVALCGDAPGDDLVGSGWRLKEELKLDGSSSTRASSRTFAGSGTEGGRATLLNAGRP
jgi:hypothetical protein